MSKVSIKNLIKDNIVVFDMFRDNIFFYSVKDKETETDYVFPVPLSDITNSDVTATLPASDKAIFFMRWIRKAIENETLTVKVEK